MKATFIKQLSILCLSVFTMAGIAQCPTFTALNVTNGASGSASILAATTTTAFPPQAHFTWQVNPNTAILTAGGTYHYAAYQFPANGTYTVCMYYNDSITMCAASQCTIVTISNAGANACNAAFTSYNDSACVTHFVNSSTGSNLTYKWYDMSTFTLFSTTQNPALNFGAGQHHIGLYTYSNNVFCDSVTYHINVNCTTTSTCNASFTSVPSTTSCATYFTNTSTGTNLSYQWYNMTGFTLLSTQQNPTLYLPNGSNHIALYTLSNGQLCDSATAVITVTCNVSTSCQANSQFTIFADTVNPGNYFAYNQSSGTGALSYLWNFGDGNTSTQAYPFHQYATPGQYVVCLTVTSTSGTISCTDMFCDSSSVHRIASGFAMSQLQVLPQLATGLQDHSSSTGLSIYPNPMENELTIEVQLADDTQPLSFMLTDALGKIVTKQELTSSKTTLNTSNLDRGIYFLTVSTKDHKIIKTTKLIK